MTINIINKGKILGDVRALAVVAHPDDETIWMGNQILRNKKWKWTIFSLCRASDKDRYPKFLEVCRLYNAQPIITDLEDEKLLPLNISYIIDLINKNLKDKVYSIIYTHGENGEYDHIRHREVHQAVKKMAEDGKLKTKRIFYFNYENRNGYCAAVKCQKFSSKWKISEHAQEPPVTKSGSNILPVCDRRFLTNKNYYKLTDKELSEKKRIITEIYGFEKGSFEEKSCGDESFIQK